jgi:CRP-like cAMP-binding protein
MNLRQYISDSTWKELLNGGTRRSYSPGAPLMHQGGEPGFVVALLQGTVKVTEYTRAGQDVPLALRGPGEVLGEVGLLLNQPRTASVWAVTRCVGHSITASAFRSLVERDSLTDALHRFALERSRQKEAHIQSLLCDSTEVRMARFLARLAREVGQPQPRGTVIHLGMDRAELGLMLRMSRATAIEALGALKGLNLIHCARKYIEVPDIDMLELYATQEIRDVI